MKRTSYPIEWHDKLALIANNSFFIFQTPSSRTSYGRRLTQKFNSMTATSTATTPTWTRIRSVSLVHCGASTTSSTTRSSSGSSSSLVAQSSKSYVPLPSHLKLALWRRTNKPCPIEFLFSLMFWKRPAILLLLCFHFVSAITFCVCLCSLPFVDGRQLTHRSNFVLRTLFNNKTNREWIGEASQSISSFFSRASRDEETIEFG